MISRTEKTKAQLLEELADLRQRNAELEACHVEPKQVGPERHAGVERFRQLIEGFKGVAERVASLEDTNRQLAQEIVERQETEATLRQSEERYRHVVERSLQGILVQQDGIVQYVNPACALMFGYATPEAMIGQPLWETLIATEARVGLQERAAARLRGERTTALNTWPGIRKDGSRIWLTSTASVITWQGRPAIEDNPDDVELTLRALRQHNLANHLEVVRDGAEALDFLFCTGAYTHRHIADSPKIVLLDLKLPKVDGLEVLRRLKSDPRTRMIPVVVLTSSHEERDIVESYQLGVNSYIIKPVDFAQFTETVRQLGLYWLLINQSPTL